jgi:Calcineurin-like phosphoesterase
MKYVFLHLSDLHYSIDWPEQTELVCNRLLIDLKEQLKNLPDPHLIFSGDLVSAGDDSQLYTAFEQRFDSAFSDIGISRKKRICVPGNHDVSRSALLPVLLMQQGTLQVMQDEKLFNDQFPQLSKSIFANKFKHYITCESHFAHYTCCGTELGGGGWRLSDDIGVYCLNTALCSFAGLPDPNGKIIPDKDSLHINTRSLYHWIQGEGEKHKIRILVMHHPHDWLVNWAKTELRKIIANNFHLVFTGHIHRGSTTDPGYGGVRVIHCAAPPLFTNKSDQLGYSIVTLDDYDWSVDITYRQWTSNHHFVSGTSISETNDGKQKLRLFSSDTQLNVERPIVSPQTNDTLAILQTEFEEATTFYSLKRCIWVDRDLAKVAETAKTAIDTTLISPSILASFPRSCIIRAPAEYGLTCLGRFMALEHFKKSSTKTVIVMVDTTEIPPHRQGIKLFITERCNLLKTTPSKLAAIILDNWNGDQKSRKILRQLKEEYSNLPIIVLSTCIDFGDIANFIGANELSGMETLYLWALNRTRIRELVIAYASEQSNLNENLDENLITQRLIADIDSLNIHRSPSNCLMILKSFDQTFDDSLVNRTELIERVLSVLFYQFNFNQIPTYTDRPDLKDCEYALGFVCEWMIRDGKRSFTKIEFNNKVQEYCEMHLLNLDSEALIFFLLGANILTRKGHTFEFRFRYWLYFFAAHRMHHDSEFAEYILDVRRYTSMPEMIEFYTGIDRRRSNAISKLRADLAIMNAGVLQRLGIPEDLDPFQVAEWNPNQETITALMGKLEENIKESSLPAAVKDAIIDKHYDRSMPYNQDLAKFMTESTLHQMILAMKGAARALRNSDYVLPELKESMLEEVLRSWMRMCQVLFLLSPILASKCSATYEDANFYLDNEFDAQIRRETSHEKRWMMIVTVLADNVVIWYQDDLFSKRMGTLLLKYLKTQQSYLGKFLVLLLLAKQRPPGWETMLEHFITNSKKNSFALGRIFDTMQTEYRTSFASEATLQNLRRLSAIALAKHNTHVKHPNQSLIEKAEIQFDKNIKQSNKEAETKRLPKLDT